MELYAAVAVQAAQFKAGSGLAAQGSHTVERHLNLTEQSMQWL